MNSSLIEPYVLNVLENHGWYKERKIDISPWIEKLSQEGYKCFECAEEILVNLGGIYIDEKGDDKHKGAQFDFNPLEAASGEFDRLYDFELTVKECLFPIGSMCQAIAYVGKSGSIYWGYWKEFYWAGCTIEDYLNNLFNKDICSKKLQFINT